MPLNEANRIPLERILWFKLGRDKSIAKDGYKDLIIISLLDFSLNNLIFFLSILIMKKLGNFNSLIGRLFPSNDFTESISKAIENNQHFDSEFIEVIPTELGPEIWLKAKNEDEIISAAKELTKVYKQNPSLRKRIYVGLKINFPSFYYRNSFGDFGYKEDSEESKNRAATELIEAIQASKSVLSMPTTSENSFGYNPLADVLYCILNELHRKRFSEKEVELKEERRESFMRKLKKPLIATVATTLASSCLISPLIASHLSQTNPQFLQFSVTPAIYSIGLLAGSLSDSEEDFDFVVRVWKKILVGTLLSLGALSFYLDASSTVIDLPGFKIKIPGLLTAIKAKAYSDSTGLDWDKSLDLALHTDTLNFLSGVFGSETEFSKAVKVYKEFQWDKELAYNLLKLFLQDGKISQDEIITANTSSQLYKELNGYEDPNARNLLKLFLQDGKISEDEIQIAYTYNQLYKELSADKDSNAYNLLKLFLQDGKISQDEITAANYYLRVRDKLIPEKLLPFWPLEERSQLAYKFCIQLLSDGKISEEEKRIAELMLNFRKPMVTVWGIKEGVISDIYKDHDNDGFSTYEELLAGKDYLNPLETPLTNDSEVYIITVNGAPDGDWNEALDLALIFRYYALKYGVPENHIITFSKYKQVRPEVDPLEKLSPYRKEFFPEIKGHLLKDYPLKIDYADKECNKMNIMSEIKRVLQLADSNDVIYIHNSSEGPGFKLFDGSGYEMIRIPDMVDIMKSAPREGKLILVNDTCGAEWYVRKLKEAMILEGMPLKDYVGIGAVRGPDNQPGETSSGTFEFIFLSKLRDGYSIKDAVPLEFREGKEVNHPVIILGEGNYDWIKYYNLFK